MPRAHLAGSSPRSASRSRLIPGRDPICPSQRAPAQHGQRVRETAPPALEASRQPCEPTRRIHLDRHCPSRNRNRHRRPGSCRPCRHHRRRDEPPRGGRSRDPPFSFGLPVKAALAAGSWEARAYLRVPGIEVLRIGSGSCVPRWRGGLGSVDAVRSAAGVGEGAVLS